MKLECILTACNDNKLYMDFIPFFIKAWKKLYPYVDVKIILISESIPLKYKEYSKNIILFTPLKDVCTILTSQVIRVLYPAILQCKEAVLITDIDMIPMSSTYFSDCIKQFNSEQFIVLRDIHYKNSEIMICYNAASPKVWSSIFLIKTVNDIKEFLIELNKVKNILDIKDDVLNNNKKYSWILDQRLLFDRVKIWQQNGGIVMGLTDNITGYKRLCRSQFSSLTDDIKDNIKKEKYVDYHCKRPFDKYKEINDQILDLLSKK